MLELCQLTWRLTDIALFVTRFRAEHGDTDDARTACAALARHLGHHEG